MEYKKILLIVYICYLALMSLIAFFLFLKDKKMATKNSGPNRIKEKTLLGICAFVFCWIPVLNWILGILAVVFGIIALVKKAKKGMAITGLVLGAVGLLVAIIISIFGLAILGAASEYSSSSGSYYNSLYDY